MHAPVIMLRGLERSGTNWVEWLLRHNTSAYVVTHRKHALGEDLETELAQATAETAYHVREAAAAGRLQWLYVYKHPGSWVVSMRRHQGLPDDLATTRRLLEQYRSWRNAAERHWRRAPNQVRIVRYEDLLARPESLPGLGRDTPRDALVLTQKRMDQHGGETAELFDPQPYLLERWRCELGSAALLGPEILPGADWKCTRPALCFVASDEGGNYLKTYERLRRAIFSAREVCHWPGAIMVLDCGLTPLQRDALRAAGVGVIVVQPRWDVQVFAAPFMWKAWVDRYVPDYDPLIVADADLEFRDPGVLDELLEIATAGRFFIAREKLPWNAAMLPFDELDRAGREAALYAREALKGTLDQPVLNAGLFGGPRAVFTEMLEAVRVTVPGLMWLYRSFWEQLALSHWCRQPAFEHLVEILPPAYNWLTAHGWAADDEVKIAHFHADILGDRRREIPEDYLAPALHRELQPTGTLAVP